MHERDKKYYNISCHHHYHPCTHLRYCKRKRDCCHYSKYVRNCEKWESQRDNKLEKMRNHKFNIEKRMKNEQYLGDSRIIINPKKYSNLCLDPSWYTDNIYSNQSIDLEDEYDLRYRELRFSNKCNSSQKYDQICEPKIETSNIMKNNLYRYPKATSCCFGMTDYVPKPILSMPKSHSFSAQNTRTHFEKISKIHSKPPIPSNKCDLFPLQNRLCNHIKCFNDTHLTTDLIDTDINKTDDDTDSRIDDWTDKIYDNNGNLSEYFTADEEFCDDDTTKNISSPEPLSYESRNNSQSIIDNTVNENDLFLMDSRNQNFNDKSSNIFKFNSFGSFDCDESFLEENLDELTKNEHTKLLMQNKSNKFRDNLAFNSFARSNDLYNLSRIRNKSLLEVKLPKKYDDSSSDSTDLELDDFNFDLNKYWENQYLFSDLDTPYYSDKNCSINCNNLHNNFEKIKNTNLGKCCNEYNDCCSHPFHTNYFRCLNNNSNVYCTNIFPHRKLNRRSYYSNHHYNNCLMCSQISRLPLTSPTYASDSAQSSTNRINLINNIFSIYKPNKYSPLNCEAHKLPQKFDIDKKNNIQASRLLPFRKNEFLSSLKRPLLLNPHYSSGHPKFKIIPEKTGLKISPLYKIKSDYDLNHESIDKNPSCSQLKSTSRPLLFRHNDII